MAPHDIATAWLAEFDAAIAADDAARAAALFAPDGHLRDILALTWQFTTVSGTAAIAGMLEGGIARMHPRNIRLAAGRTAPRRVTRAGVRVIEVILAFETDLGTGSGVLRLHDAAPARAFTLSLALEALHGYPDVALDRHASDEDYSRDFGGENWLDKRNRSRAYADRDPAVLVVGGGQAGLGIAARLKQLGVDTLIIDREARIGDNWRNRYHALTLHNEVHVNHLPYMPFPPTWPVFIPKDKLANWFESYVDALDLNAWTFTELAGGSYDEAAGHWTVMLRRDGAERVMRPRHIVFATGVSSIPKYAGLPGQADFAGTILHSGAYTDGAAWKGRRAIVVGTGNSGHDVAQDLHASGAHVTMVQRSPTYVVSIREAQSVYAIYTEGLPIADCDLLATAMPYEVLRRAYQLSTAASRKADAALLAGLEARGFRLDFGADDTGFQMKYLRHGGGYYFNVGCSDLIVDGSIGLIQYDSIDRLSPSGLRLKSGETLQADLLVMATGYLNQQDNVRAVLGNTVADRIGPVWGFDEGGELRNMWRQTQQPGLWFTAGSLAQCRIFSRYLALQIKATESGIAPR